MTMELVAETRSEDSAYGVYRKLISDNQDVQWTSDSFEDLFIAGVQAIHEGHALEITQGKRRKALDMMSLRTRFRLGSVYATLIDNAPGRSSIVTRIAGVVGVNERTIRTYARVGRYFECNEFLLDRWIAEAAEKDEIAGREQRIHWKRCTAHVAKQLSAAVETGDVEPEEAKQITAEVQEFKLDDEARRLTRRSEDLERDAEDYRERAEGTPVQDEADAAAFKAVEIAGETRRIIEEAGGRPAIDTWKSEAYLDRVRQMPCVGLGTVPSEPHHCETGGTGMKGHDAFVIPVSREVHDYIHEHGIGPAQQRYGFHALTEAFQTYVLITTDSPVRVSPQYR